METWQLIISICAGLITIMTFFDKVGLTKSVKKVDSDFKELKELPEQINNLSAEIEGMGNLQKIQNQALLAILRNDLYRCFKDHRDLGAWTDDDCQVQTKIHEAYKALGGNGEEAIWWEKKKSWKIYSEDEMQELIRKHSNR
jgi:hypothetical protein